MAEQDIRIFELDGGLTLIVERMPAVASAAFSLYLPAGSLYDRPGKNGTAALLCDLLTRGAGDRDTRSLSNAFDSLGLQRSENVGSSHIMLGGSLLAENLPAAVALYADVARSAHLPEDQFAAVKSGVEQSLRAVEDEPRQKVMVELRRCSYDGPWGWPAEGNLDDLPAIGHREACDHFRACVGPRNAILGVAGNVDADAVREMAEGLFAGWKPQDGPVPERTANADHPLHLEQESAQTHIGIAFASVPYRHEEYYAAWAAAGILGGGSSCRLFTEVRERRGLCYSVYASLHTLREDARMMIYAGTTAERAQETLDVIVQELHRLQDGVDAAELERCKARAKSALIMQQESTFARASSLPRDWFHLGRVTSLDEVRDQIDGLSVERVNAYLQQYPPDEFALVTVGPEPLQLSTSR